MLQREHLSILVVLLCLVFHAHGFNVGLHAQVTPGEKVVGSVITTDGLKAAFEKLPYTDVVKIFYPYNYDQLFNNQWDLIVIEGWFPSIDQFLGLVRHNLFSNRLTKVTNTVIIYICLDAKFIMSYQSMPLPLSCFWRRIPRK